MSFERKRTSQLERGFTAPHGEDINNWIKLGEGFSNTHTSLQAKRPDMKSGPESGLAENGLALMITVMLTFVNKQ